jgi:tetratricopeptide (TPR) repeat protein
MVCTFGTVAGTQAQNPASEQPADLAALLQEGIRLYNESNHQQAVMTLDTIIGAATPSDASQRDLLARAYEYRARARYSIRPDKAAAESDFASLLQLRPGYQPLGMSPVVVQIFTAVRTRVLGDLILQLTPPGPIEIDGVAYTATAEPLTVPLSAGEHTIVSNRRGYRSLEQRFVIPAGQLTPLSLALERTSATLFVRTIPSGVEVLVDGVSKGVTAPGTDANGVSEALVIPELDIKTYAVRYQRSCYYTQERSLQVTQLADLNNEPLQLEQAVATVTLRLSDPDATTYVDGRRGPSASDVGTLCEGEHLIDVRSPRGRFIDQRYWRPGDKETLTAVIRPAFAIVVNSPPSGITGTQFRTLTQRALADAKGALIFGPADEELTSVLREPISPDFFHGTTAAAALARGERGARLSADLGVQGLAAIESSGDPDTVRLSLLTAGSMEPETLTLNLKDPVSLASVVAALAADLPPLTRTSLEALIIDVANTPGAVVVRPYPNGIAASVNLAPGDVITDVGGSGVGSVADLFRELDKNPGQLVTLTVRSLAGATRSVPILVKIIPDTLPLADKRLVYNGILLRLRERLREATPADAGAVRLNLAIVEMRLGQYQQAIAQFEQVQLPDGAGVSAGTVSYLLGLCYEALGRRAEATTAYTNASKSTDSRLSYMGPPTAPLAQERLQSVAK